MLNLRFLWRAINRVKSSLTKSVIAQSNLFERSQLHSFTDINRVTVSGERQQRVDSLQTTQNFEMSAYLKGFVEV